MDSSKSPKKQKSPSFFSLVNWKWVAAAFISSISISIVLSLLSSELLNYLNVLWSLAILFFFIAIGVVFDIIGLAVTTADISPFNSMAARKIRGGKKAVSLIKNADRVSSFCNDIVGDIAGIVSGATATAIAIKIVALTQSTDEIWMNLIICGAVSALTVSLKAIGKAVGLNYGKNIVTFVARVLSIFEKGVRYTDEKKKK
ncbi:MAG: hypothetical protein KBS59_02845 [Clostridiales bacterium]|nr:hypothetical protein [Clostridiales bacterium]